MPTEHYLQLGLLFIVTPLVTYCWQRFFRLPSAFILIFAFIVLNVLDVHSTIVFIKHLELGISAEGNPVMRYLFEIFGFPLGLFVAKTFLILPGFLLFRLVTIDHLARVVLLYLNLFYLVAVTGNYVMIFLWTN